MQKLTSVSSVAKPLNFKYQPFLVLKAKTELNFFVFTLNFCSSKFTDKRKKNKKKYF